MPQWLTGLGCQLGDGQRSALHAARLCGEKDMSWLGVWDRVCHEGMSESWKRGVARPGWDYRGHWRAGVTE